MALSAAERREVALADALHALVLDQGRGGVVDGVAAGGRRRGGELLGEHQLAQLRLGPAVCEARVGAGRADRPEAAGDAAAVGQMPAAVVGAVLLEQLPGAVGGAWCLSRALLLFQPLLDARGAVAVVAPDADVRQAVGARLGVHPSGRHTEPGSDSDGIEELFSATGRARDVALGGQGQLFVHTCHVAQVANTPRVTSGGQLDPVLDPVAENRLSQERRKPENPALAGLSKVGETGFEPAAARPPAPERVESLTLDPELAPF